MKEKVGFELQVLISSIERGTSIFPSIEDCLSILHKCRKKKNLTLALHLRSFLRNTGLEAHPVLGSRLISLLVELGSIPEAQQIFDVMVSPSQIAWDSLIRGYISCGKFQIALCLYEKMQVDETIYPSEHTFVALLKACTKVRDIETGAAIHAKASEENLVERNIFIGATLVDMYAQCGYLNKAQQVFDQLPMRDVVAWNALISGYAHHEHGEEALMCFEEMQLEGLKPNSVTYVCSLKGCSSIKALEMGLKIHAEIEKNGIFERNVFIGNALIDMYAKCGSLLKSRKVYDRLLVRDVISHNTLISGYTEHGKGEEALELFEKMQCEGILPNVVTYTCALKACAVTAADDKGQRIHVELARRGMLAGNLALGNALVDMYAKCGSFTKARETFCHLMNRDVVTCNALLSGYLDFGCADEALKCFDLLQKEGIMPDTVTYICILKSCSIIKHVVKGQEIHAETIKRGLFRSELDIGNATVDMYVKCGVLSDAQKVFEMLPFRDEISWNILMGGFAGDSRSKDVLNCFKTMQLEGMFPNAITYVFVLKAYGDTKDADEGDKICADFAIEELWQHDSFLGSALIEMHIKHGLFVKAQELFDKLLVRDTVIWNVMIAGYVEHEKGKDALICFDQMRAEAVLEDIVTLVLALKACSSVGSREYGRMIHLEVYKKGLLGHPNVSNAIIDMYAKCDLLLEAQKLHDDLDIKDVVSWNALIAGYAQLGESERAFSTFNRMIREGTNPDAVTFICVLKACSHSGLFNEGWMFYKSMSKDYAISPTVEHQNCMVDLLGSSGRLDKAVSLIEKIPSHPNLVVWDSVLNACRKWGNVALGKRAFDNVVQSDPHDAGPYILMSHIYRDAGIQDEADKIEKMRLKISSMRDTQIDELCEG